ASLRPPRETHGCGASARSRASTATSSEARRTAAPSAGTRPAAIAAWALARLPNKPRSDSSRAMRLRWMQLLSKGPTKGTSGDVSGLLGAARLRCQVSSRCCSGDHRCKVIHGTEIFEKRVERRQTRDAQAQEGNAQERPQRKKGEEPQAGDRHRAFRGAPQGQESPEEEILQAQAQIITPNRHM